MLLTNIRNLLEFDAENVEHTSWRSDRDFSPAWFGILARVNGDGQPEKNEYWLIRMQG